jgi:hypothetical protein
MCSPNRTGRRPLVRTKPAATHAGLSPSTLAKLRLSGNGPPYYQPTGKIVFYDLDEVDEWARRRRLMSTSEKAGQGMKIERPTRGRRPEGNCKGMDRIETSN